MCCSIPVRSSKNMPGPSLVVIESLDSFPSFVDDFLLVILKHSLLAQSMIEGCFDPANCSAQLYGEQSWDKVGGL